MVDELLTLVLLMSLLGILVYRASFSDCCNQLFDKKWSTAIKGLCCILVILVHIPREYSTRLQDIVGSFAYIAVTTFFLLSGYGLTVNKKRKGYVEHFWRNRLVALFIPMLLVNLLKVSVHITRGACISIADNLLSIDGFVLMILLCYSVFYFVFGLELIKNHKTTWICVLILMISLITYFFEDIIPFTVWPVPCLGFMYGVLLAENRDIILMHLEKYRILDIKTWMLFALTLLIGGGYLKGKNIPFFGDYVLRSILALLMLEILIKVLSKFRPNNKAIDILGEISYEVYLSHGLVISVLKSAQWNLRPGVFILSSIVITVILSYILHQLGTKLIRKLRVSL